MKGLNNLSTTPQQKLGLPVLVPVQDLKQSATTVSSAPLMDKDKVEKSVKALLTLYKPELEKKK